MLERDIYRPLTDEGHRRAGELAELLADEPVGRLLSSPATRCAQTLGPLSHTRGIELEECAELWEGSGVDEALALLAQPGFEGVVACSHGDIIPAAIERLGDTGVPVHGRGCELGSVWVLGHDGSQWTGAHYVGRKATSLA